MKKKLEITDNTFKKISNLIYRDIGLKLPLKKKALLKSRLTKRLLELEINDFKEYYKLLLSSKKEKLILLNMLTTNVTSFFRGAKQLHFLKNNTLPILSQKLKKRIKVWSAGCSSGEEAYTLGIILDNFFDSSWEIDILATDVNTNMLDLAQEGIYSENKVKDIPSDLLNRYFIKAKHQNDILYQARFELKSKIRFGILNLNDYNYSLNKKFDIIFCRNVFIYFDKKTRKKVVNNFCHKMKKDSYLFLGNSDNLSSKGRWKFIFPNTYKRMF